MTINVPSQYQLYVQNAANQLGISPDIVAAQIQTESSWNPNAVSPTGAQGIAQFEPGTWSSYGSGSPFDPANAFPAYTKYMGTLLRQFNGNVREALAAYNAGPGNLPAGYGYADGILSLAGNGASTTSSGVAIGSSGVANATPASSILSWPDSITTFFTDISSGVFWLRVLMVIVGSVVLIIALFKLTNTTGALTKAVTSRMK